MPALGVATTHLTPFLELSRSDWARLAPTMPLPLTIREITELRGLGEPLDLSEVTDVYLPLSRLLNLYITGTRKLSRATQTFLGMGETTPFVIGIAGSVAVGKSTIARLLRELLARWPNTPRVELVTTDGFLLPNAELNRRGLMNRKGFPESYAQRNLLRFVSEVKAGAAEVEAPVYSHLSYDIIPEEHITVTRPDVLIIEGLNVLQPPAPGRSLAVADFFDFSIYVDAQTSAIANWFEERFLQLQQGAFANPLSYFHRYATLGAAEARSIAQKIWREVNEPNLIENIRPTRPRAHLVLQKSPDHRVSRVLLRKI